MRFLCFHGMGMNSQIFKTMLDRITSQLGDGHTFEFINGTVHTDPFPGFHNSGTGTKGPYLRFCPPESELAQIPSLVYDLLDFLTMNGPFDGVLGFSEGGCMAAMLMIEAMQQDDSMLGLKCGIFLSALTPVHLESAEGGKETIRYLDKTKDGVVLNIPTAHIWSPDGEIYPGFGEGLVGLCNEDMREEVIHHLGHEVPGSRSDEALADSVRAIARTIERVRDMQVQ